MNAMNPEHFGEAGQSWRRKRSPDTTIKVSQNHNMNMNIVKASAINSLNVDPPSKWRCVYSLSKASGGHCRTMSTPCTAACGSRH